MNIIIGFTSFVYNKKAKFILKSIATYTLIYSIISYDAQTARAYKTPMLTILKTLQSKLPEKATNTL